MINFLLIAIKKINVLITSYSLDPSLSLYFKKDLHNRDIFFSTSDVLNYILNKAKKKRKSTFLYLFFLTKKSINQTVLFYILKTKQKELIE